MTIETELQNDWGALLLGVVRSSAAAASCDELAPSACYPCTTSL